MAIIDTSIEIARTPAEVRAIVLDFDHLHEWHTSFIKVMQPLPKGQKTPQEMQKGDKMYLKFLQAGLDTTIAENSSLALRWQGGTSVLFCGIHSLEFEPIDEGCRTRFKNGELFTGIFGQAVGLPGIKGMVESLYLGYNRDLKRRCEEGDGSGQVVGAEVVGVTPAAPSATVA